MLIDPQREIPPLQALEPNPAVCSNGQVLFSLHVFAGHSYGRQFWIIPRLFAALQVPYH